MKTIKNEGSVRPAFALAVLMMVLFTVGGYALNYVKYSDSSYWSDSDAIVATTVTATTVTATTLAPTTLNVSGAATFSGAVTVIGTSVTSRWDNAASKIDGEVIADDTIDDDSIDFADVTGADLTLTDCGTITASGILTVSNSVYMGHPSVWKTITSDGGRVDVPTALGAVTNTQAIAGLSTFHTVAPAGTVTNTIAVPTVAGRVMTIINIAAQDWILEDSGTVKLAGAATLNQYDSITLRAIDASLWVEVNRSNN